MLFVLAKKFQHFNLSFFLNWGETKILLGLKTFSLYIIAAQHQGQNGV
jgi:hypothetical protein